MKAGKLRGLIKKLKKENGTVYAWMLFLLPVFLLLLGISTDLAILFTITARVQTALDVSGTSALSSSLIEESIIDGNKEPEVDDNKAEQCFCRLVKLNLSLDESWKPVGNSFLHEKLIILNTEVERSGPPKLKVSVLVPFKTTLLHYFIPEVKVPVYSESILENDLNT